MKNKWLALTMVLLITFVWGCEDSPTGTEPATDEEAIEMIMDESSIFNYDAHYGAEDTVTAKETKSRGRYTFWWRHPEELVRNTTINIVDDSAYVTFSPHLSGQFNLLVTDTLPPDTLINYPKDLNDEFMSYAIFRNYSDSINYRGWRLEKISGIEATSSPNAVQIDSIRVQSTSYSDTVISDIHRLVDKENILTFQPEEDVTLTVYSDDSVYAFLHARGRYGGIRRWWRWRFMNQVNGGWQRTWKTPLNKGVYPAIFDILHMNTLDDNQYRYDSNGWLIPYRIE